MNVKYLVLIIVSDILKLSYVEVAPRGRVSNFNKKQVDTQLAAETACERISQPGASATRSAAARRRTQIDKPITIYKQNVLRLDTHSTF